MTSFGAEVLNRLAGCEPLYNPNVYELIEKHSEYPSNDDFDDYRDYDNAVDRAEIRALIALLTEELNETEGGLL